MSATRIEWAEAVWNPITGCTPCSPGCAHCYAKRMAKRLAGRCGYPADDPFRVTVHGDRMKPKFSKKPKRVFVCSMSDLFHDEVPYEAIGCIITTIAVSWAWNEGHTFMLLTKRPERMRDLLSNGSIQNYVGRYWLQDRELPWPLPNLWLGVTVCNQAEADSKIPVLLETPAAVRFVSVEPMLGPVDLREWMPPMAIRGEDCWGIDWVICGGETGPGARPMHPMWVRGLRNQCAAAKVPFFFKSWGEWAPERQDPYDPAEARRIGEHGLDTRDLANCTEGMGAEVYVYRVGKKAAGRLLDGCKYNKMPREATR